MSGYNIHVYTTLRHLSGCQMASRPLINRSKSGTMHTYLTPYTFVTLNDSYFYNYHPTLP